MIRLYRAPFSTNVERVALALGHKRLEVESVWIDYGDRSPVQRVSGQPLVPVVEFEDGTVVHDSMRIVRALEERFPAAPLYSGDAAGRAALDEFVDWLDRVWKVAPNAIEAEIAGATPDFARVDALASAMAAALDRFEAMLDGHEHLLGDAFSAADCAAYPFLKYALCAIGPTTSSSTGSSTATSSSASSIRGCGRGSSASASARERRRPGCGAVGGPRSGMGALRPGRGWSIRLAPPKAPA